MTAGEERDQLYGADSGNGDGHGREANGERALGVDDEGDFEQIESPAESRSLRELAADAIPAAVVVVHIAGTVAMANAAARRLFGLSAADVGQPFQNLEISCRPVPLRPAVEQVQKEQRPVVLEQVRWPTPESVDYVDIHLVPVLDSAGATLGVAITFIDVSLSRRLQDELDHSNRNLETAYEELERTNEQLETTNVELQSTIEQLETTNVELQSTNAELETMNAELHSTNDDLQTINDELRMRTGELDDVNDFLESMLISQRGGLVVIDSDLRISVWNDHSAEMWGLRPDEAPGQHFLNLDIGLPVEDLRQPIKAVLSGDSPEQIVVLAATNRRGREFRCQVTVTPLVNREGAIRGAILLMEDGVA